MAEPIRFYFDFASPYAYFAANEVELIARTHGRTVDWRPVLIWAVFKAQGIAPPMELPAKRDYFVADMQRSAAFHGLDYSHPARLPVSTHRAARLYYTLAVQDVEAAPDFGRAIFAAYFTQGLDISQEAVVVDVAGGLGISEAAALRAINGDFGRERLAEMIDIAVADKVCGSPWFIVDGESFFGADRLPQIAWRLGQA